MRRVINIGKLNQRITFLSLKDSTDAIGQKTKKLEEIATVWGSLYPAREIEFYEQNKIQGKTTYKCYIRYMDGITINCFLRCGNVDYSIESVVDVDMQHKMLEILCTEHTNKEVMSNG